MTPESYGPSSGPGAARILTQARESSRRLQGAVSVSEGWWTITSAVLIFVMIAGGLRTRHGIGSGLALGVVRWPCCWRGAAERRCGSTLVGTTSGTQWRPAGPCSSWLSGAGTGYFASHKDQRSPG